MEAKWTSAPWPNIDAGKFCCSNENLFRHFQRENYHKKVYTFLIWDPWPQQYPCHMRCRRLFPASMSLKISIGRWQNGMSANGRRTIMLLDIAVSWWSFWPEMLSLHETESAPRWPKKDIPAGALFLARHIFSRLNGWREDQNQFSNLIATGDGALHPAFCVENPSWNDDDKGEHYPNGKFVRWERKLMTNLC